MLITKRRYLNKPPQVGDTIKIREGRDRAGAELVIIDIKSYTGDCVRVYDDRTERSYFVHDNWYDIYEDVVYESCGYNTVTKRFLGIPIYKKTTEIIREVGAE